METGKFKLILYWLANIIGFYLLWLLTYFFAAKQALSEINEVSSFKEGFWHQFDASKAFAYLVYGALIALLTYAFYWLAIRSPLPKIAATVYIVLIAATSGIVIFALADTSDFWHLLPHWSLNLIFIIPLFILLLYKFPENRQ